MDDTKHICVTNCTKYISTGNYCVTSCGTEYTPVSGNKCQANCDGSYYLGTEHTCVASCSGLVIAVKDQNTCITEAECKLSDGKYIYT